MIAAISRPLVSPGDKGVVKRLLYQLSYMRFAHGGSRTRDMESDNL